MKIKAIIRSLLPRAIHPHRVLSGSLRDEMIVTSWHDYPTAIIGRTERALLSWFAGNVRLGETWLDIGAHYGYTAIALARLVGESGRIFAFEPMLSTVGYLNQTRLLNNLRQLTILPVGLSDFPKIEVVRMPSVRGMIDSTIERDQSWKETILVTGLDWFWPQICNGLSKIHGVKIDVQGMELHVLRGMTTILMTHRPKLVIEVHQGVSRPELVSLIDQIGYTKHPEPIEPVRGEDKAQFIDNRSYYFYPV